MTTSRRHVTLLLIVSVAVSLGGVVAWRADSGSTSVALRAVAAASDPPSSPTPSESTDPQPTAIAPPEPDAGDAQALQRSVREAALRTTLTSLTRSTGVDFAVTVVDHISGATFTFNGDTTFETASVVKVEILAALLLRNDGTLTASQKQLADVMIRESDNDAASALWGQIDDVRGLAEASSVLGLTDTVPGTGGWWSLTTTTVADQVRLVDSIVAPNGPLGSSNQTIIDLMGNVIDDQDWGISAAAHDGESVILKNGWMPRSNQGGRWTVNSVGRITGAGTDLTMAIMTRGSASSASGIALVEQLAKLARAPLDP
jgi:Beta-lactamase enzyme family